MKIPFKNTEKVFEDSTEIRKDNILKNFSSGISQIKFCIKTKFTLLRIQMKTDRKVSVFTLRSHCSAAKTETFENAKCSVNTENESF